MKKADRVITRSAREVARALALEPEDAVEIEVRASLAEQIAAAVNERGLTHAQIAKLARTSRSRVTAIVNRNIDGVTIHLLLRIVGRLGYRARVVITRAA